MDKACPNARIKGRVRFITFQDTDVVLPLTVPMCKLPLKEHLLEQVVTQEMPVTSQVLNRDNEEEEASILQTVSIRIVARKRAEKKIRAFFANLAFLLASMLILGGLIAIIIVIPSFVYKATIIMFFLIICSYIASIQAKYIDQARKGEYLTVAQFLQAIRSVPKASEDYDMKHFELSRQDTITYLHALTTKHLKKDARS